MVRKNAIYITAFFIPVSLMLIIFMVRGVYPFGDRFSYFCLFLFVLLLILIIMKCWLLYRATQSENQEDSAYASTEQSV